jgi:hypothetical protein
MRSNSLERMLGILVAILVGSPATAGVPDLTQSFYVPQAGDYTGPVEGDEAIQYFRVCPNNDGDGSLPLAARIKVVARDQNGNPLSGIVAEEICILFNGGTPAQGFSGIGADSVIANSTWNNSPMCPDVRCIQADATSDANGVAYITFTGPGGVRDPNRKWGHYDSELPVYVLGYKISGRLTSGSANGTYILRIKNLDQTGGLGANLNQGESVTTTDFNAIATGLGINNAVSYWRDFDSDGVVGMSDFNLITFHVGHNCGSPNNP